MGRKSNTRLGLLGLGMVALAVPRAATAQGVPTVVVHSWSAPASCPSQEQFIAKATEELAGSVPDDARIEVSVTIDENADGGLSLTLHVFGGERVVRGTDCQSLVDVAVLNLALAAELAIDSKPTKTTEALPTPTPAPTPKPKPKPTPPTPTTPTPTLSSPLSDGPTRDWRIFVAARWTGSTGLLPGFSSGASVAVGVRAENFLVGLATGYWFEREAKHDPVDRRGADVSLVLAEAFGCYTLRLGTVSVGPCLSVELGGFRGRGFGAAEELVDTALWLGGGPGAHIRWATSESFALVASAMASVAVRRPVFVAEPNIEVFRPDRVSAQVAAGFELYF